MKEKENIKKRKKPFKNNKKEVKMATTKGCKKQGKSAPRKKGEKCGPKLKKKPVKRKKIFDDSVLDIFR